MIVGNGTTTIDRNWLARHVCHGALAGAEFFAKRRESATMD
jgi:hypothetical protein